MSRKEPFFKAEGARIIGHTSFGSDCSVWYNAVIRADNGTITVGDQTNIQDNSTLHLDASHPLTIGNGVTVGHNVVLHGCTIGDNTLIGMGAIILNGAKIGKNAMVAAGALVPSNMEVPDGMLAIGSPAKVRRPLTPEEIAENKESAKHYMLLAGLAIHGVVPLLGH